MIKHRELLLGVTLFVISTVICLAVAEITLRFLPVASGLNTMPVTADSPVYHFSPNKEFLYSRAWYLEMPNRGHTNNDGQVNDQDYYMDDQTPLVAIIGDSFVEAAMVPYPQTFHGLLAKSFEDKARIYSFGASGAPLSQYLVWARYAVGKFKARALVINVVGNDFDESRIEYKFAPGFWYYSPAADGQLNLRLVEYRPGAITLLVRHSALLRYLVINCGITNILSSPMDWLRFHNLTRDLPPHYAGFTLADPSPARIAASTAAVDAFLRDLRVIGLPPGCVTFTIDGFRYPEVAEREAGTYFDIMRRYFRTKAEADGYEVIDLDPLFFSRHRETSERFEYLRDGHWNANGHLVVANALRSSKLFNSACSL